VAKDEDEIVVPKKSKAKAVSTGGTSASASMRKLMRITCAIGIALGGFVALVGVMAVVGLAISNIWVRLRDRPARHVADARRRRQDDVESARP